MAKPLLGVLLSRALLPTVMAFSMVALVNDRIYVKYPTGGGGFEHQSIPSCNTAQYFQMLLLAMQ